MVEVQGEWVRETMFAEVNYVASIDSFADIIKTRSENTW